VDQKVTEVAETAYLKGQLTVKSSLPKKNVDNPRYFVEIPLFLRPD
jgi:hypothetical protein